MKLETRIKLERLIYVNFMEAAYFKLIDTEMLEIPLSKKKSILRIQNYFEELFKGTHEYWSIRVSRQFNVRFVVFEDCEATADAAINSFIRFFSECCGILFYTSMYTEAKFVNISIFTKKDDKMDFPE
ncbi:hypothetical protein WN51_11722 [Melipona quadrifasciata]|uniref:Uncharacterized protein n=1 Tax=Melipona quadrifasciata TaxID=166423 RepID=A0A0N0BHS2_9HYME|nr:hypothetical protein WN51_11722 [Melipona quadrifasciata]